MSSLPKPFFTPKQYLQIEREAEFKSEYLSGEIFAMAGATEAHNLIVLNIGAELRSRFRSGPCRTYPSDMKVECGPSGLYTYPDVSVVCGQPIFHDARTDMVLNPILVVEVISPSTEAYDRGVKFAQYKRIEPLTDYLLVWPTPYRVEHHARQPDGEWQATVYADAEDVVVLASLNCALPMSEIYDRVEADFTLVQGLTL